MDILASMFAYLMSVTAIIGALAISAFVVLAKPDQPAVPIPAAKTAMIKASAAKTSQSKTATVAPAKPETTAQTAATPAPTSPTNVAADKHADVRRTGTTAKTRLSDRQLDRHLAQQDERARRWAYQQDPNFEGRFQGYTD